jgi:adenylate cyclase class 2
MPLLNVEIKARYNDPSFMRRYLLEHGADFRGIDSQTDTYFNVQAGRLKLRQGNIENNLIYYQRENQAGPKNSHFQLAAIADPQSIKELLTTSLGIKVVVQKKREIYFIDNVKFHIDEVPGLGNFVEIEASNKDADLPKEKLKEQCDFYMHELKILDEDLISVSYSDMILKTG